MHDHQRYVGHQKQWQGMTALLRPLYESDFRRWLVELRGNKDIYVMAQFDDTKSGMGCGWHPFLKTDFQPIGPKPIF